MWFVGKLEVTDLKSSNRDILQQKTKKRPKTILGKPMMVWQRLTLNCSVELAIDHVQKLFRNDLTVTCAIWSVGRVKVRGPRAPGDIWSQQKTSEIYFRPYCFHKRSRTCITWLLMCCKAKSCGSGLVRSGHISASVSNLFHTHSSIFHDNLMDLNLNSTIDTKWKPSLSQPNIRIMTLDPIINSSESTRSTRGNVFHLSFNTLEIAKRFTYAPKALYFILRGP